MQIFNFIVKLQKSGHHKQARKLLAQISDPRETAQAKTPSIQIDPQLGQEIQQAVKELQKAEPNIFQGVSKIVALTSGPFGQVSSEDPSIIHINIQKVKQEVKNQIGSQYDPNNQQHNEALQEATKRAIVEVVAHEAEHVHDFDYEKHDFPGGEGVADTKQQQIMQKLYQGKPVEIHAQKLTSLSKFATKLNKDSTLDNFKQELKIRIAGRPILLFIKDNLLLHGGITQKNIKYIRKKVRKAANQSVEESDLIPNITALMHLIKEVRDKYNQGDLKHLAWYKKMLSVFDKYKKMIHDEWEMLLTDMLMIEENIRQLDILLPKTQNKTITDLEALLRSTMTDSNLSDTEKWRKEKILIDLIRYRIPGSDSVEDLSVLLFSPNNQIRELAKKRIQQLSTTREASNVGVELVGPGSTSGPQYNITGNEFAAGGTSVVPWSTRNKKLLELLKKKKHKKQS